MSVFLQFMGIAACIVGSTALVYWLVNFLIEIEVMRNSQGRVRVDVDSLLRRVRELENKRTVRR